MKKALLFTAAAVCCMQAHAQFPYFLQDHNGNNINYKVPVDLEFDGSSTVYSLHSCSSGPGLISTQYSAGTGSVLNVSYITRGNASLRPVRVRTLGTNYYVLFNSVSGAGVAGYCLVSLTSGNVVNWSYALVPPASASRNAVDFIIDGSNTAYILSTNTALGTNQSDVAVTCVTNLTGAPTLSWDNVYQNTSRAEYPSNIIYRSASNEVIVSAISADLANPTTDRGPVAMRLSPAGTYLGAMLYKYAGCNTAEPNGTWVFNGGGNLYLSSTSIENGANGPLWLAKVNATSLGISLQSNHRTNNVYLNPEIQPLINSMGNNQVLISGASAASLGYVHLEFATPTLALTSGVVYPGTNPQNSSPIYDVYISTGPGMNIFSVAENVSTNYHYYLMKTSDAGHNDCEDPYTVTPDPCTMNSFNIAFTRIPVTLTTAAPTITVASFSNSFIMPCYVPMVQAPGGTGREQTDQVNGDLVVSPNPSHGIFTLSAGNHLLSAIQITNTEGKLIPADISEQVNGVSINLSGKKSGVYVIKALVNGEPQHVRVVLE